MKNVETITKLLIVNDEVHLVENDEDKGSCKHDDFCYFLPDNSANRHFFSVKKIEAMKAKGITEIVLEYRASRKLGSVSTHIPNEKLIAYLPDDLQAEYKAIIQRAIEARDAAKAKPMTELEKAQAKLLKAQEALAKLQAQAAGDIPTDSKPIVD